METPRHTERRSEPPWAKVAAKVVKHQWLINLGFLFVIALGFGFETPKAKFDSIESRSDTVDMRIDTIKRTVSGMQDAVEIIAIDVCMRRMDDAFVRLRLKCNSYIGIPSVP